MSSICQHPSVFLDLWKQADFPLSPPTHLDSVVFPHRVHRRASAFQARFFLGEPVAISSPSLSDYCSPFLIILKFLIAPWLFLSRLWFCRPPRIRFIEDPPQVSVFGDLTPLSRTLLLYSPLRPLDTDFFFLSGVILYSPFFQNSPLSSVPSRASLCFFTETLCPPTSFSYPTPPFQNRLPFASDTFFPFFCLQQCDSMLLPCTYV